MKKVIKRLGILLAVFILGVLVFSGFLNKEATENKTDMNAASLPVMAMKSGSILMNRMYGYSQDMQVDFMRDSLTPIGTDKSLTVSINPYGHKLKSLVYEVRTSDGSKVVENAKIKSFEDVDGEKSATFTLEKSILMNQEYSLRFTLNTDKGSWHYYTRILQRSGLNLEKYLEFVESFSSKTFNKDNMSELQTYMEPNDTTNNNSFMDVSIHSSLDMVTWGSLAPSVTRKGIPVVKDINETTGSIAQTYFISAKDEDGIAEMYQVDEFYRLRYDGSRVMMLDFQRSSSQIFTGAGSSVASGRIILGVAPKNVQYAASHSGEMIAFVSMGDLWMYNTNSNKLSRVFSFRKEKDSDERYDYVAHGYKIVRVGENGDMDFVVYGYMNRGEHEGKSGTAVYHYASEQNVLEEKFFLPSSKSYEFLKKDLETLSYVSTQDIFYLSLDKKLYQINMKDKSYEVLEHAVENAFISSNSNRHAAWMKEEEIVFMDLETGKAETISPDAGTQLKTLGFINEDLVYGIAKDSDVVVDGTGSLRFAMNEVRITKFDGGIVDNYKQDGTYVMGVNIQQGLLELTRAQWSGDRYVDIISTHIINNTKVAEEAVISQATGTTVRRASVTSLIYSKENRNKNPLVVEAKFMTGGKDTVLNMEQENKRENAYYVYARGGLQSVADSPALAVQTADAMTGVVLNRNQQYVWERGNLKTKISLNLKDVPDIFKTGSLDTAVLQEGIQDAGTILDLSGCSLNQALYQVSAQRPVIAKTGDGQSKVIVGYDPYNTILYDPATGQTAYCGMEDSTALFEAAGNIFISFIENIAQ